MKTLIIHGAGGHGKVVADTARAMAKWNEIVFVDSGYPESTICEKWPIVANQMGLLDESYLGADFIIAIGNNSVRVQLFEEALSLGYSAINVIHPFSYISPDAQLDSGIVIFAGSVINIGAKVGSACILNTGATVDHDCILGEGVHVSPGANLAGNVSIGNASWIGAGSTVRQSIKIGDNVVIGAGATVVSNIDNGLTVVGTPAKPLFS